MLALAEAQILVGARIIVVQRHKDLGVRRAGRLVVGQYGHRPYRIVGGQYRLLRITLDGLRDRFDRLNRSARAVGLLAAEAVAHIAFCVVVFLLVFTNNEEGVFFGWDILYATGGLQMKMSQEEHRAHTDI